MGIFDIDLCFDLLLPGQRHFTADEIIKGFVTRPNGLRNLPDRGTQVLTVTYCFLNIALRQTLINGLNMIMQIVIQFGIVRISTAQRLIIPLYDFRCSCFSFAISVSISRCWLTR